MNFDRFSVSLKVESDEKGFYDCVVDLKESKELSSTLVTLLHLYYEDEEIRSRVDNYEDNADEFIKAIKDQFDRVQMFHQQSVMQTEMARSHIEGVGDIASGVSEQFSQATGGESQQETDKSSGTGDKKVLLLEQEIETVKQSVGGVETKLDKLMEMLTQGQVGVQHQTSVALPPPVQVQQAEVVEPVKTEVKRSPLIKADDEEVQPPKPQVVNNLIKEEAVAVQQPVLEPVAPLQAVVAPPQAVEPVQTFELPQAQPQGFALGVVGNQPVFVDDDDEEDGEDNATTKTQNTSFNKLMGSIKKNK